MVLGQRRDGFGETLVESRDVGGAHLLESSQLDIAGDDGGEAPVIRASEGADPRYLQLVRVDLWLCSGSHLVVEIGTLKRATAGPLILAYTGYWLVSGTVRLGLLFRHKRIPIVRRRRKSFLDVSRAYPAHEIELRAGLVVGAGAACSAEGLLPYDGARGLVVDVEIAGSVAQNERCLADRLAISAEHGAGERVGRSLIDDAESFLPLRVGIDVRGDDGAEDLFAQQAVGRIFRLDQCRLDEVPLLTTGDASRDDVRALAAVLEVLSNLGERLLVDHGAHEIPEVGDVTHPDVLHDRDGAIADLRPDRLRDIHSARRGALLTLILESTARDGDG